MSNKRVKSAFVRQRAPPEGETKEQCLVRLEKEKQRKRLSRQNESDEQRQKRLEAQRERNRARLQIETIVIKGIIVFKMFVKESMSEYKTNLNNNIRFV